MNYKFDMEGKDYNGLADSLNHWAEIFYMSGPSEDYSEQMAYLLHTMAEQMREAVK